MADQTKLQTILGAELQVSRMPEALLTFLLEATNANHARRLLSKTNGYVLTDTEESAALGQGIVLLDSDLGGSTLRNLYASYRDSHIESAAGFFKWLASEIAPSKEDEESILDWEFDESDGVVTIPKRKGMWGALYRTLETDGYIILSNGMTIGSLTALSGNRGTMTGTTLVFRSNALSGTVTFDCVDESVSAPKFRVTHKLSKRLPDGTVVNIEAVKSLQCEKAFTDPKTGCHGVVITRSGLAAPTVSGDHASTPLYSAVTITTPFDGDCTAGVFFTRISRETGDKWRIDVYADAAFTTKVGTLTTTGTSGVVALSKTLQNGSVLALTFSKANAHAVHGSVGENLRDISIDIKTARLGDKYTVAITNDEAANYATKLAKLREGLQLPEGPAKPGSAATAALAGAGAGNVDNGTHSWKVTFVNAIGESEGSAASNQINVTDKTTNGKVNLSSVPTGPAGTTKRKIYRTVAGDTGNYKYVGEINDNSTTTFQDNVADASLGANILIQWTDANAVSVSMS